MRFKIQVLGDRAKVVLPLEKQLDQLALARSSISNRIAATAGAFKLQMVQGAYCSTVAEIAQR